MDIFRWQIPTGPDAPFGSSVLIVLDSLRILIVICCTITSLICLIGLFASINITQRMRVISLIMSQVYVALTEIQRIGDYANWRLLLGTFVAIFSLFSMLAFIQFEGNSDHIPENLLWLRRRKNDARPH